MANARKRKLDIKHWRKWTPDIEGWRKWTPDIAGWQYPIENDVIVQGEDFKLSHTGRNEWYLSYDPRGKAETLWGYGTLEYCCKVLTAALT